MSSKRIDKKMSKLVLFRGTIEEIKAKLSDIGLRRDPVFEPFEQFEENLSENDFGFNANIGNIGDNYLDYEIYLLPTNVPDNFIITEVNKF